PSPLLRPLLSEDTEATVSGVESLGAEVVRSADALRVSSDGLRAPGAAIDARNSGTPLPLLTGVAALLNSPVVLTGDASLVKRPMGPLLDALNDLGARARSLGGGGPPPLGGRGPPQGREAPLPR